MKQRIDYLFLFFIPFLLSFCFGCSQQKKFIKLEKTDPNYAILYILRVPNPSLGLYKFEVRIEKYRGHFKNSVPIYHKKIRIGISEYCTIKLEESFYNLKLPGEEFSKILYLENGKDYYFNFEIISNKFFSFPEFFLRKITKEDALKYLLEHNRMELCSELIE